MSTATKRPSGATVLLLTLSFGVGFAMMLVEVTATRLMAPFFGTSVYTWTNVIGSIMAALAAGYYLGGKVADRWPRVETALTLVLASGLLTALVPFAAAWMSGALTPAEGAIVSAVPLFARASLLVTIVVFVPPLFLMGALSPVIVRLLSRDSDVGWASGANAAAATSGAILGTFAPTFWLVPAFGSRRTILIAAGLQLVLAAVGFWRSRRWRPASLSLLGLVSLVPLDILCAGPLAPVEGLVAERETAYQYARVVRQGDQVALQLEGQRVGAQSVYSQTSFLVGSYYDHALLAPFLCAPSAGGALDLLVLGFGAGTVARQYTHFFGPLRQLGIDGVEIDPALLDLGREYFDLDRAASEGLRLHVADGRTFLQSSQRRYDIVFIDVFTHDLFVPFHMTTREFFELVRAHLKPGGVVVMNAVVRSAPSHLLSALESTLNRVFDSAWRLRRRGSWSLLLIASREGRLDLIDARRRVADYPPAGVDIAQADQMRAGLLAALGDVTRVDAGVPAAVLTDDHAPTEVLMLRDMLRSSAGQ